MLSRPMQQLSSRNKEVYPEEESNYEEEDYTLSDCEDSTERWFPFAQRVYP